MYEDLLAENRPFPDSDIETIPPEALGLAHGCTAASYLRLETALARIAGPDAPGLDGLFNADPATSRYTVLTSAANGAAYSVIAVVPRTLGARDQVRAALDPNVPPALIASADGIGSNRAIFFSLNAALTFERSPRIRFLFHWLREVAVGRIEGQLGTDVDSGIDASVRAVLSDRFLAAIALDAAGRLRLRLFRHRDSSLDAGSTLTVETGSRTPLEGRRDELIATILEAGSGAPAEAAAAAALAGSVYDKALAALKTKFAAALSWSYSRASHGAAVGEASFEFTAQGLADYRAALAGDFRGALTGEVTEALSGENSIELHLPFLASSGAPAGTRSPARASRRARTGAWSPTPSPHPTQSDKTTHIRARSRWRAPCSIRSKHPALKSHTQIVAPARARASSAR